MPTSARSSVEEVDIGAAGMVATGQTDWAVANVGANGTIHQIVMG